jgi:hypothetical protein
VVVVVEVAAAEAGAVDCYLDLVCGRSGQLAGFLFVISILSVCDTVCCIGSSLGLLIRERCGVIRDSQCGGLLRHAGRWLGLVSTT